MVSLVLTIEQASYFVIIHLALVDIAQDVALGEGLAHDLQRSSGNPDLCMVGRPPAHEAAFGSLAAVIGKQYGPLDGRGHVILEHLPGFCGRTKDYSPTPFTPCH